MGEIVVVGSLNADLVIRTPHFPRPGETIQGDDLATIAGGKGANQAVAAARLGAHVTMIGCVGADSFGSTLIENLKKNNVDARHVRRDGSAATGTAIIMVDGNGENSIVLSPGANARISPHDVEPAALSGAKLLLLQLEIPLETVLHTALIARNKKVRVILNPAPARDLPDELLQLADYLVPNQTELARLSGRKVKDQGSLETAARTMLARGVKNLVVTLGEKGALIANRSKLKYVESYKVRPVDTTGAGDAFIGGMAVALLQRKSLQDAVQYACACGALATTRFGAQPSLPTAQEVKDFLRSA